MSVPDYLDSYITAGIPICKRQSRLNSLRKYLTRQDWFSKYNFTAENTFAIYPTDGCLTDQTGLNFIFELDDIDHLEGGRLRWKDEWRDQWLLGLKNKNGGPLVAGVLRLSLWPPHRSDIPTLAGKIHKFVLNPLESKKTVSPVSSPVKKAEAKVEVSGLTKLALDDSKTQKKALGRKKKKKHPGEREQKQEVPLVKRDMLLKAIANKSSLQEMQILLKGKHENCSDSQKAHILIRILETDSEDQMDILEIFCQRFSAEVIACTDQNGLSPIVRAVELQCLQAIEIFAKKTPKKMRLSPPQWQEALNLANRKKYQAIENVLVNKGIRDVPVSDKKQSQPDAQFSLNFKDQFIDSKRLLSTPGDFINSVISGINEFSERQLQTIALQGNSNAQMLMASWLKEKKDNEGCRYWLEKSAIQGNASAQLALGNFYAGMETETDENRKKAVEWFQKAAGQGLSDAQYCLGVCYQLGIGVAVNHNEALEWYYKAVEQNHSAAQSNLASYYLQGIHVKQDEQMAFKLYGKSAKQGNKFGQYNLGKCYRMGMGVTVNPKKAIKWYKKSAKQNHPEAQTILAQFYLRGEFLKEDPQQGILWCRKAVESGLPSAQYTLGNYYLKYEKDHKEAKKWYQKAAEQNMAEAQYAIGFMYSTGSEGAKDEKEAVKWYRKAAEQGLAEAQYLLGNHYKLIKNEKEAVKWWQKAAEQGVAEAQYNVGHYYQLPERGEERDFSIAIYWFTLAAKKNLKVANEAIPMAQALFGTDLMRLGQENEGIYWLKQAKNRGSQLAENMLTAIKTGIFSRKREILCATFSNLLTASWDEIKNQRRYKNS